MAARIWLPENAEQHPVHAILYNAFLITKMATQRWVTENLPKPEYLGETKKNLLYLLSLLQYSFLKARCLIWQ